MNKTTLVAAHILGLIVTGLSFRATASVELEGVSGVAVLPDVIDMAEIAKRFPAADAQVHGQPQVVPSPSRSLTRSRSSMEKRGGAATIEIPAAEFVSGTPTPQPIAGFAGAAFDNWFPPDTQGAVGPGHMVIAVNGQVTIQNRSGVQLMSTSLSAFWGSLVSPSACVFDPRVSYDAVGGRWILISVVKDACGEDEGNTNSRVLVGASTSNDPTGLWYRYAFSPDPTGQDWADFPNLGFNGQWIVIAANMFSVTAPFAQTGARILELPKAQVYAGASTGPTTFVFAGEIDDIPTVALDTSTDLMYLVNGFSGTANGQPDTLRIRTILPGGGIINGASAVGSSASSPVVKFDDPQLGGPAIDGATPLMVRPVIRNGYLWCAQKIALPATGVPNRGSVQWWQVAPSTGQVLQFGRIDDPTGTWSYDYPSIAVNKNNDVMIGFSVFSAGTYAAAGYSTRSAGDPVSTMRVPYTFRNGDAPYLILDGKPGDFGRRNRWGDYSATVVDPIDDIGMWTLQEYAASPANQWGTWWAGVNPSARLVNLSTRGDVMTGGNVMIGGFVIGGTTPKTVAVTATGPSLANFGISNPLPNPTLTLAGVANNDDWQTDANHSLLQASGFAPSNPLESGLYITLSPGAYTGIVQGVGGSTGIGVVGLFEVDHTEVPLINVSTRGFVGTGENVMIGGFIIQGGPMTVAITATGPSLAQYGISNPLGNPLLRLIRSSDQSLVATNDNWVDALNHTQIQQSGFAPSNNAESAILMTLDPGAYTAIVIGADGGTGVSVVGVFAIP